VSGLFSRSARFRNGCHRGVDVGLHGHVQSDGLCVSHLVQVGQILVLACTGIDKVSFCRQQFGYFPAIPELAPVTRTAFCWLVAAGVVSWAIALVLMIATTRVVAAATKIP